MRVLWIAAGFASLGFGLAGTVLPLLPTTPFVLLSAFCFARSSPRFHAWLTTHPTFGPMLHHWHEHRAISRRAKIAATMFMVAAVGLSVLFEVRPVIIAVQLVVMVPVLTFIWTRNTVG